MRNRIAAAVLAAAALALTACSGTSTDDGDTAPTELSIATIGTPESFTPGNFGTGPTTLFLQPVYDTLIRNDNEGEPGATRSTAPAPRPPARRGSE